MSVSRLLVLVVIIAAIYFGYFNTITVTLSDVGAIASSCDAGGAKIKEIDFEDLFYRNEGYDSLVVPGCYTIVELSLDTCSKCKALEERYESFTKKREDVAIRIVNFSNEMINRIGNQEIMGGESVRLSGDMSRDEINEINRKLRAKGEVFESRLEDYGMGCGMPYVLVFGPDSSVLAQDGCNKTQGLDLIENWMTSS